MPLTLAISRAKDRELFYRRDGRTRIRRIYNRVILDELERKRLQLPFDYRDDLDVEWTGHPEWYFRISSSRFRGCSIPQCPARGF